MSFWQKIGSFFTNFFTNVKADPVSSVKGLVQLAIAGGTCYGMATGAVPIAIGAGIAGSAASSGILSLGTNNTTGVVAPVAQKAANLVNEAAAVAPTATNVVDQMAAIKKAADDGQKSIDTFQQVSAAIAQLAPALAQVQQQVTQAATVQKTD